MRAPTLAGLAFVTFAGLAGWTYPPKITSRGAVPGEVVTTSASSSLPGVVPPACALASLRLGVQPIYHHPERSWLYLQGLDASGLPVPVTGCPAPVWGITGDERAGLAVDAFGWSADFQGPAGLYMVTVRVGEREASKALRVQTRSR